MSTTLWLELAYVLHLLAALAASLHAVRIKREASSALLWLLVIWSFPVVGVVAYVVLGVDRIAAQSRLRARARRAFGESRRAQEAAQRPMADWRGVRDCRCALPEGEWARALHRALDVLLPDEPLLDGNDLQLLITGDEAYPRIFDAIASARSHVHLQTFILAHDDSGRRLMDLLLERARAGVEVRVLFDRFGSTPSVLSGFVRRWRRAHPRLRLAGWTLAKPWRRQFQLNLRNHRKILVVDGRVAFTGGMNISDVNVTRSGRPADRDFHFEVRGPVVQELQYSFLNDWHFMTGEAAERLLCAEHFPPQPVAGRTLARVVNGEPSEEGATLPDVLFAMLAAARRQVVIVTPYFVPTMDILRALRVAALRGIEVKLLLPKYNNHVYAGWAGRSFYEPLLTAGAQIVERSPPFLHAKALIVDDEVAMVGSANLDSRSLRLNYETNLLVWGQDLIGRLKAAALAEFACGEPIATAAWLQRPAGQRWLERAAALLSPVL
ncbi:MAG: cardiolipin synthase [Kiritimatiellae bacterium]|nr:cardiolipin synthase [Kiritimatiellia bacterium]